MENQLFYGSICLTDISELAKKKNSAFVKAANGKIYVNVHIWLNAEEDKFGNVLSIKTNPEKSKRETDGSHYIGNCKRSDKKITDEDVSDLPF